MSDHTDLQAVIDAARQTADPYVLDPREEHVQAFAIPEGGKLATLDVDERCLAPPRRLAGVVKIETVASLRGYVAEFYDPKTTTVWVDMDGRSVTAVLDDAQRDQASWRGHRAGLALKRTEEWQRWRKLDGQLVSQQTFAEHIEESELDIATPPAADLLEIAQTFHASTSAEFKSGTRLKSGEIQLHYVEETSAAAGRKGELSIPDKFDLSIAPFEGERPCAITALLRYRVRDGNLAIGYKLVRPNDVEREAMGLIAEQIRQDVARVYLGSPAS